MNQMQHTDNMRMPKSAASQTKRLILSFLLTLPNGVVLGAVFTCLLYIATDHWLIIIAMAMAMVSIWLRLMLIVLNHETRVSPNENKISHRWRERAWRRVQRFESWKS